MTTITEREQRTLRIAGIGILLYLTLFFGAKLIKGASSLRAAYDQQVRAAQTLRSEVQTYEVRALRLQRLMEQLQLEPGKVATNSIIAQTSAALQQAAVAGGLQIGSIRESVARSSERELGTIQLDATGLPLSIMSFLARLEHLGFPVIVDAVQLSSEPRGPGMLKVNFSLIILDFEQWKPRKAPHA